MGSFTKLVLIPRINGNQYSNMVALECANLSKLLFESSEHQYDWQKLLKGSPIELTIPLPNKLSEFVQRSVNCQCWKVLGEAESLENLPYSDIHDKLSAEYNIGEVVMQFNVIKPAMSKKKKTQIIRFVTERLETYKRSTVDFVKQQTHSIKLAVIIISSQHTNEIKYLVAQYINDAKNIALTNRNRRVGIKQTTSTSETNFCGTPLPPGLSLIMCNMAQISRNSLIFDPFCGQGSILKVAQEVVGARVIGSDIRALNESQSVVDTCEFRMDMEFFQSNIFEYSHPFRNQVSLFDAIICDPPFGRRELVLGDRLRAVVSTESVRTGNSILDGVIPYLFLLSSNLLSPSGRLVFTYPDFPNSPHFLEGGKSWNVEDLLPAVASFQNSSCSSLRDVTKSFKLIGHADQTWKKSTGHVMIRRIVVFEKLS